MKTPFLIAAASGALLLSTAATAQVQSQPQPQQTDVFGQILGAMFGNNQQASEQALENDWNQGQRPFAERRARLDARIDTAVRDGTMSRSEADQIRRDYDDIVRLESQYAADGNVSPQQRSDLRTRYRALTQRVGGQGQAADYQANGRWQSLSTRNAEFEQRLAAGVRNRSLTQADTTRLRSDWRTLAQVEAGYQRGGLDAREQADLWSRYNAIDARLGGASGFGNDRNPARWTQLETRLATAERNGRISRNEAGMVRAQLNDLARLDAVYATGGYSTDQRTYLSKRWTELDTVLGYNRR
jgi:opacity protein-like surface antigen